MAPDRDVDGGWAWVVLFLCSICRIAEANVVISAGLFQIEFLENFCGSTSVISLLPSVLIGLQLTLGPVSSVLCNRFSIRVTMMTGGILFSLGLISASFSTDLPQLFITYSVIAGTGFGIAYTPLNVILGHYFVRRRAVANGISASAAGWLRDVSMSYSLAFHVAGTFAILGSFILLLIPGIKVKDESKLTDKTEMLIHEDKTIVIGDVTEEIDT